MIYLIRHYKYVTASPPCSKYSPYGVNEIWCSFLVSLTRSSELKTQCGFEAFTQWDLGAQWIVAIKLKSIMESPESEG